MKTDRIRLVHVQVPPTYLPGYPRGLSAQQFQALLAPRNRERRRALFGAACAALALSAGSPGEAEREAQVVAMLQRLAEERPQSSWLWSSIMHRAAATEATAGVTYVPRIPISFGNSAMGLFDSGRARLMAVEVFRAYGIELETGAALDTPSVHARLDGADRARKIAFKLRGANEENDGRTRPVIGGGKAESASSDLDATELAALVENGWKLHVTSIDNYPLMDGDQLTPTVAYLAGVIEFLNAVTDGPDLDLRSVLMGVRQRFEVPSLADLGLGKGAPRSIGNQESLDEFELGSARTVTLRFNQPGSRPPTLLGRGRTTELQPPATPAERAKALSTAGCISALQIPISVREITRAETLRIRLTQVREPGAKPLLIEARSKLVFTPSSFDAARPFELEISLPAGEYYLLNSLDVSVLRP